MITKMQAFGLSEPSAVELPRDLRARAVGVGVPEMYLEGNYGERMVELLIKGKEMGLDIDLYASRSGAFSEADERRAYENMCSYYVACPKCQDRNEAILYSEDVFLLSGNVAMLCSNCGHPIIFDPAVPEDSDVTLTRPAPRTSAKVIDIGRYKEWLASRRIAAPSAAAASLTSVERYFVTHSAKSILRDNTEETIDKAAALIFGKVPPHQGEFDLVRKIKLELYRRVGFHENLFDLTDAEEGRAFVEANKINQQAAVRLGKERVAALYRIVVGAEYDFSQDSTVLGIWNSLVARVMLG